METQTQEAPKVSIWTGTLEYAAIMALALIGAYLLFFLVDMHQHWINSVVSLLAMFGLLTWGMIRFRDQKNRGYISYGRALGAGVLMSVYYGAILGTFNWIFMHYISPETIDITMEQAYNDMVEQGVSEAQIKMSLEISEMFFRPYMLVLMGVIGGGILGTLLSLIGAAIAKRNPEDEVLRS